MHDKKKYFRNCIHAHVKTSYMDGAGDQLLQLKKDQVKMKLQNYYCTIDNY